MKGGEWGEYMLYAHFNEGYRMKEGRKKQARSNKQLPFPKEK